MNRTPIYINARFLGQQKTGVQVFAREMVAELEKKLNLVLLVPKAIHENPFKSEMVQVGKKKGYYWEQVELPKYLRDKGSPVLLNLCNTAPLRYTNNCITIHDLAFRRNPEWFNKRFAITYNYLIPKIIKRARHVFTVSESVKQEIIVEFGTKALTVVPNALPESFSIADSSGDRFKDLGDYILMVAPNNPRKNVENAIKALELLQPLDLKLIIIGEESKVFNKSLKIKRNQLNDKVRLMGYLSTDYLKAAYINAKAFLNPSFYEGFGITNLEAMSCDCPIIVSDIPVFREVLGDSATYIDPNDAKNMAKTIQEIMDGSISVEANKDAILSKYTYEKSAGLMSEKLLEL